MFKCWDCGRTFDEPNTWRERSGEVLSGCPSCGGSFDETKKCQICGCDFLSEELYNECICEECLEEQGNDFDTCYKIAENQKEEIKINALLTTILDITDIETILYQFLKNCGDVDCSEFINQDKDWFAEKLMEMKK